MPSHPHQSTGTATAAGHYARFCMMILLSFLAMYFLMYAMIDSAENFFMSLNQAYMAGLMAAAMVVLELAVMFAMHPNKRLNVALIAAGRPSFARSDVRFFALRTQPRFRALRGVALLARAAVPYRARNVWTPSFAHIRTCCLDGCPPVSIARSSGSPTTR